jgi:hypothetical protein
MMERESLNFGLKRRNIKYCLYLCGMLPNRFIAFIIVFIFCCTDLFAQPKGFVDLEAGYAAPLSGTYLKREKFMGFGAALSGHFFRTGNLYYGVGLQMNYLGMKDRTDTMVCLVKNPMLHLEYEISDGGAWQLCPQIGIGYALWDFDKRQLEGETRVRQKGVSMKLGVRIDYAFDTRYGFLISAHYDLTSLSSQEYYDMILITLGFRINIIGRKIIPESEYHGE